MNTGTTKTQRLTPAQVAKAFGVSPNTIYRWLDDGVITSPPRSFRGLKRQFDFSQAWLDQALLELEQKRNALTDPKSDAQTEDQ